MKKELFLSSERESGDLHFFGKRRASCTDGATIVHMNADAPIFVSNEDRRVFYRTKSTRRRRRISGVIPAYDRGGVFIFEGRWPKVSWKRLGRRLIQIALVLLGISFITFALVMLSPGDPVRQMIAGNEDIVVSQQELDALRAELGLDKPFIFQYLNWLGRALKGNLGFSYSVKAPVIEQLMISLKPTLMLSLAATAFMLVVSLPLGVYSAVKQNSLFDWFTSSITFMGISIPNFWMGLMLLWTLGLKLKWLPIVGGSLAFKNLIMPALTLGIVMASKYTRQVRAAVLEELHQDYVTGARARGMTERYILWKEVLPNAMLPLITLLGLSFGSLLGGSAVVEIVFSWPGLGYLAVEAIIYRDFQLVQGIVLWIALMYMVINLVVDMSYTALDPRLRKAGH